MGADKAIESALYAILRGKTFEEWSKNAQALEGIKSPAEEVWQMASYILNGWCVNCYERVKCLSCEQPTIDVQPVWIPCSERMPEKFEYVLCAGRDGMGILRYTGAAWLDDEAHAYTTNEITHWMPLPDPPA